MRHFLITVAAMSLWSGQLAAQTTLRDSLSGERMAAARRLAQQEQAYQLRVGRMSVALTPSFELELNDNVNFSDIDRQGDLILRPQVSLASRVPITLRNSFYSSLQVGYSA